VRARLDAGREVSDTSRVAARRARRIEPEICRERVRAVAIASRDADVVSKDCARARTCLRSVATLATSWMSSRTPGRRGDCANAVTE